VMRKSGGRSETGQTGFANKRFCARVSIEVSLHLKTTLKAFRTN
jgi:hypothetical protein